MANPWDRPPIPTTGDADDNATYAGVGRVLTQWEEVEVTLSQLYVSFSGRGKDLTIQREYGSGTIFRERIAKVVTVSHGYFCAKPSQAQEGEFEQLVAKCMGFSARRNDVAHGIV